MRGRILFAAALPLAALAPVPPVHALDYPTRPINVIVPFPPGGAHQRGNGDIHE